MTRFRKRKKQVEERTIVLPGHELFEFQEEGIIRHDITTFPPRRNIIHGNVMAGFHFESNENIPEMRGPNFDFVVHDRIERSSDYIDAMIHGINAMNVIWPKIKTTNDFNARSLQLLDNKYPHQCHACRIDLRIYDLLIAGKNFKLRESFQVKVRNYLIKNYNQFDEETINKWSHTFGKHEFFKYIRKLWKSPHVEFYCCTCHELLEKKI